MKISSSIMKQKYHQYLFVLHENIINIFLRGMRCLEEDFICKVGKSTCHRFQTQNTICRDENDKKKYLNHHHTMHEVLVL